MTTRERGLVRAVTEAVRPFVRRLLDRGIALGEVEARLRELWVDVAESELERAGTPASDSRIALMTGVHRKEVRRLRRGATGAGSPGSPRLHRLTTLISRWEAFAGRDADGKLRPLPYQAGRSPGFSTLARQVTTDLAPRVLLDELLRTGAARMLDGDRVELLTDSFVPRAADDDRLQILAEDPAELVETMLRNVLGEDEGPLLQRKVYYDNLGRDGSQKLRTEMRREGERFLARVNRLLARYDRDRNPRAPGGERFTAGVGVYYYDDPPAPAPPTLAATRKKRIRAKRKKI